MDMIARKKKIMMAMLGSVLPPEYQKVEYIQSDGNQYIDSGIECTSDLVVNFGFSYFEATNMAVCGGIASSNGSVYFRHHCSPYGAIFYWIQKTSSYSSVSITTATNTKYDVFIDPVNGIAKCNNTQKSFTPLESGITTGRSYGIFARINNVGNLQSKASKFYYFKFKRNGVLIGNFVPCYRKSDGVIGMYDTVTKTFFTNAGTGTFTIPS